MDITKLRLWLSLVVEDNLGVTGEESLSENKSQKDPETLPNLDCNIMCGNSLIDEFEGVQLFDDSLFGKTSDQISLFEGNMQVYLDDLKREQNRLFGERTPSVKNDIKKKIDKLIDKIIRSKLERDGNSEGLRKYEEVLKRKTKPYFLWKLEFAHIFREKGGFDVVIGNPPYLKERDNKHIFEAVNRSSFGERYHQGKMDYWYYFLHKAIDISHTMSTISYITPRYWLNSAGATNLISRIKNNLDFAHFIDIGDIKTFENVVGYHMVAVYRMNKKENSKFTYKELKNNLSGLFANKNSDYVKIEILNNNDIYTSSNQIVVLKTNDDFKFDKLGDICEISQGVVEAPDKISKKSWNNNPLPNINVGDGVFVLTKNELVKLNFNNLEKCVLKKYLDGKDVDRYVIFFDNKFLIYSDKQVKELIAKDSNYSNIKRHLDFMSDYITSSNSPYGIHRPRNSTFFDRQKLITPSMFKKPQFALDEKGYYVGMSFSVLVQKNNLVNLKYLLGLLNSKYAQSWFQNNGKHRGIGVDIGVEKLRDFPVPKYNDSNSNAITGVVDTIIKCKNNDPTADTSVLESEIDRMVYELYGLTDDEIEIVEGSVK